MTKRLEKSKNNRFLAGVLAGIGEYFGLDENAITIVRIVYAVLAFMSMGSLVFIYILLYFILPDPKPENGSYYQSNPNNYSTDRKVKDAEVVREDTEDDWSDF